MSTRPASPADWATNTNYAAGPAVGTPTKVAPSAGDVQEGYEPAVEPGAQKFNYQLNLLGQWTDWLNAGLLRTGQQVLTAASGTYTPTTGTRAVRVRMVGGGGGGGGALASSNNVAAAAAGGASGIYWEKWISPAALITGGAYVCGAAGAAGLGGTGGFEPGGAGGDTTIVIQTVTYTAKGGGGGQADISGNVDMPRIGAFGGAPQAGSSASDAAGGDNGGDGWVFAGLASPHLYAPSGKGGSGSWGIGGANTNASADGGAGSGDGAGGGGGAVRSTGSTATKNGGAGTAGKIIVEEYS